MEYRYMMCGSFTPENYENVHKDTAHHMLSIEIPSPFTHKNEKEAMKDEDLAYRFISVAGEVVIAVFPGEGYKAARDEEGMKAIETWVKGTPLRYYTYAEFKENGGLIYEEPKSTICVMEPNQTEEEYIESLGEWLETAGANAEWKAQDYEAKATFNDLFPALRREHDRRKYIDNEAYYIAEIEGESA